MDAGMEIIAGVHIHAPMASACVVVQNHIIFKPAPVLADNSLLVPASAQEALCEAQRKDCGGPDFESGIPRQEKGKGKSKGKDRKAKPSAKNGDFDFDEEAEAEPDEPEGQDADQDDDPEAYLVEAQTSEESEMDSLRWHA